MMCSFFFEHILGLKTHGFVCPLLLETGAPRGIRGLCPSWQFLVNCCCGFGTCSSLCCWGKRGIRGICFSHAVSHNKLLLLLRILFIDVIVVLVEENYVFSFSLHVVCFRIWTNAIPCVRHIFSILTFSRVSSKPLDSVSIFVHVLHIRFRNSLHARGIFLPWVYLSSLHILTLVNVLIALSWAFLTRCSLLIATGMSMEDSSCFSSGWGFKNSVLSAHVGLLLLLTHYLLHSNILYTQPLLTSWFLWREENRRTWRKTLET
jgi:hypothetical protein